MYVNKCEEYFNFPPWTSSFSTEMNLEDRLQQVIDICAEPSLVAKQDSIVSPKDGDHFVVIVGEGIYKSRLGNYVILMLLSLTP